MKNLVIITGPIAAGKSSLINKLTNIFNLYDHELISTDYYLKKYFLKDCSKIDIRYKMSKIFSTYKLDLALKNQNNVIWETVVAKEEKIAQVLKFKNAGYKILLVFVGVNNVNICTNRAKQRELIDGYHIDVQKIKNRYSESLTYFNKLRQLVDDWIVIDNSSKPVAVVCHFDGKTEIINKDNKLKDIILKRL